jgi:putative ABC transport system permease protein
VKQPAPHQSSEHRSSEHRSSGQGSTEQVPTQHGSRLQRPSLHWPSIRGRARADRGPLALVAGVVLVVSLIAAAVPPLMTSTADAAAQDAVRKAVPESAVQATALFDYDDSITGTGRTRDAALAEEMDDFRAQAEDQLDPALRAKLRSPVTTVTATTLVVTDGSVQRHFQMDYLRNNHGGPAVTWVSGHEPRGTADGNVDVPDAGPKWEVQIGLSEVEAAALKLKPGQHVPVEDDLHNEYNYLVSGIYRPVDPNDPAWQLAPWVLRPVADIDGFGSTRFGGLMSPASLPDGRVAMLEDQMQRAVWFSADPDRLTWVSAQELAATVANLKATSASSGAQDTSIKWDTQLDRVLRDVRAQVNAAYAQASVLLIAVLTATVLVLLLAADLLMRRRASALTAARQRGAGLPTLATELLVESAAVTLPAAAVGIVLALVLTGGAALWWAAPVIVCALAAGPAFGTLAAARATRDRRAPANRAARRWALRTTQLRRAALDVAVVALAVGAIVALRQRGISAGADTPLPASAPTLGVVTGALILLRLLPAGTGLALRQSLRSRRALAVFGTARAAATATRVLPLLVLTTTTALAAFAITLDRTTSHGMEAGAWQAVGADARLDVFTGNGTTTTAQVAARIAAAPGVTQTVTADVADGGRVIADGNAVVPTLVVVDSAAFQRLLAGNPLPDAPQLSLLKGPGKPIPALVHTGDGSLRPGMTLQLEQHDATPVLLKAVGTAPTVDNNADVVIVDAAAGLPFTPNTIWAAGPGAAAAVRAAADGGHALSRADVVHDRRSAPLNAGLVALDWAVAGTLLALGLLGFALAAAASAPERWETLARLRTLGLRPRDAQRVAGAELLPPVLVAAICGPLLALLLVKLTFGPLALHTLTGQAADPAPLVPWWLLGLVALLLLATLVAVVATESAVRRRRRLSEVLRVGG